MCVDKHAHVGQPKQTWRLPLPNRGLIGAHAVSTGWAEPVGGKDLEEWGSQTGDLTIRNGDSIIKRDLTGEYYEHGDFMGDLDYQPRGKLSINKAATKESRFKSWTLVFSTNKNSGV